MNTNQSQDRNVDALRSAILSCQDNKADLVTLDAGEVYSAVKQFGLTVVAKEIYRDGIIQKPNVVSFLLCLWCLVCHHMPHTLQAETCKYVSFSLCLHLHLPGGCILAVAVVRNSSTLDMHSLRGSRSCHSGARWTAGWSLPLGHLLSRNLLPWAEDEPLSQGKTANHKCYITSGSIN